MLIQKVAKLNYWLVGWLVGSTRNRSHTAKSMGICTLPSKENSETQVDDSGM
ncbi:MAG: hypothetical protein M5F18_02500 [Asgard group archaeon]|nr:hypothetical protein [Asgard group archaeon]